jgi:hypothetical protein
LLDLAAEKGILTMNEQEVLLKWREDPAGWAGI